MPEQPIFEIREFDGDKHIKIFLDGHVEGIDGDFIIINRIPTTMDAAVAGIMLGQKTGFKYDQGNRNRRNTI